MANHTCSLPVMPVFLTPLARDIKATKVT